MKRVAFLGLLLLTIGCGGGDSGVVVLEQAPLVLAAGPMSIDPAPQDTISGQVDLSRFGHDAVGAVYELTTPAGEPFVFDVLSRSEGNSGPVRVSVGHAADDGATPVGGPETLPGAGIVVNATGMTQRGQWVESNGDGFARVTLRGEIDRDQILICEVDDGVGRDTALIRVRIGPPSEINTAAGNPGDYPGVLESATLYSSDSGMFGLPTAAVSGDRTSIVVYEGDRANEAVFQRYELRLQYDHVTKAVTGGGGDEPSPDFGNWRDHEVAALFNVLALVHGGTERVTLKLSFDRGATITQTEQFGTASHQWAARLVQIAMADDYTLAVVFWQTRKGGGTDLLLVEGRPDDDFTPTAYTFDPPRVIHSVPGDAMPIILGATYSSGGDLAIGYGYTTITREDLTVTTRTAFRSAVRRFGTSDFVDTLVDEDVVVGRDPSVAVVGSGPSMRIFYAYEGRDGVLLRTSADAGQTWSAVTAIGDRNAHLPTVIARDRGDRITVDVLYLTYADSGLELHLLHWEDFDGGAPQSHRLTEASIEEVDIPAPVPQPGAPVGILPPTGPMPRITEIGWFGYDATLDGDEIIVVYDEFTHDAWFGIGILPLGPEDVASPAAPSGGAGAEFQAAEPPPLAPGLTEPMPPPDPEHAHQLKWLRLE